MTGLLQGAPHLASLQAKSHLYFFAIHLIMASSPLVQATA